LWIKIEFLIKIDVLVKIVFCGEKLRLRFSPKIKILVKNPIFGQISRKLKILVKIRNFGQNYKFGSKLELLVKIRNSGQN